MKKLCLVVGVIFLAFFVVFAADYFLPKQGKACFKDKCFDVELAANAEAREKGLMYREKLEPDKGMLFIFEKEGRYSFWMKNTWIPLDIIWMNKDKEVVYISRNTESCRKDPCPYASPGKNALYVLEVNAGMADRLGLKEGDKIVF